MNEILDQLLEISKIECSATRLKEVESWIKNHIIEITTYNSTSLKEIESSMPSLSVYILRDLYINLGIELQKKNFGKLLTTRSFYRETKTLKVWVLK